MDVASLRRRAVAAVRGGGLARHRRRMARAAAFAERAAATAPSPEAERGDGRPVPPLALAGPHYREALADLHAILKPRSYVEIGVDKGETLALAAAPSVAIDPGFAIDRDVAGNKPFLHYFQGTSDEYFGRHEPERRLGGPIELAMIDGMHLFEVVLRDFINVERHAGRGSVVALHDCVPCDPYVACRRQGAPAQALSRNPSWWTGDVWKVVPILRRLRPDLAVAVLDAPPTGLVVVTGLDPRSTTLLDRYEEAVREMMPVTLFAYGFDRFVAECRLQPTEGYLAALAAARP